MGNIEIRGNSLKYWKDNAEEDYLRVPISVLKYISILEELNEKNKELYDKGFNDGANAAATDILN